MADAVPSSAALAKMLAKIVQEYDSLAADIEALFDFPTALRTPAASRVLDARRRATLAAWDGGLRGWNERADRFLEFFDAVDTKSEQVDLALALCAADFGGLVMKREWDASGRTFAAPLILAETQVLGPLRLEAARFMAGIDARGLGVAHDLAADQAEFVGRADFSGLRVAGSARFANAIFSSDASFAGAKFGRWFWFRGAQIKGNLNFVEAEVKSDASFGACRYGGAADFRGAAFQDTVSFEGAIFDTALDLSGASFGGKVLLAGLELHGAFAATGTQFRGQVNPPLDSVVPPPQGPGRASSR